MQATSVLDRTKWFVYKHFERLLVVLLVSTMLLIHYVVVYQLAFLSFYYLPVIVAGFFLGRTAAVSAAVFIVTLVVFFNAVVGLDGPAGHSASFLIVIPWGGFLVLTAYVVGTLAEDRQHRLNDLKASNIAMLELLTFHLESSEQHRGHSFRVSQRAVALGRELEMESEALEDLRIAALLHELDAHDPRVTRLFADFPGKLTALPFAGSMRSAMELVREYAGYHAQVGEDWPVDQLRISLGTKVLAVADAYETLQMPTPTRPPFAPWTALEEIEKGAGHVFASEVVRALRKLAAVPERVEPDLRQAIVREAERTA